MPAMHSCQLSESCQCTAAKPFPCLMQAAATIMSVLSCLEIEGWRRGSPCKRAQACRPDAMDGGCPSRPVPVFPALEGRRCFRLEGRGMPFSLPFDWLTPPAFLWEYPKGRVGPPSSPSPVPVHPTRVGKGVGNGVGGGREGEGGGGGGEGGGGVGGGCVGVWWCGWCVCVCGVVQVGKGACVVGNSRSLSSPSPFRASPAFSLPASFPPWTHYQLPLTFSQEGR